MTVPARFKKGDRVVTTTRVFAPAASGLIPAGTTGTITRGGRFGALVTFDIPDRHGNPTTAAAILPRPSARIVLNGDK